MTFRSNKAARRAGREARVPATGASILYITYDGLTDPLGRSQVLPYLVGLSRMGHRITILSCEKSARLESEGGAIRAICAEAGIAWHPGPYHKNPPILSSVYDARMLGRAAERLHREQSFDIVHCRSYIASIAGLRLARRHGVRFLFDMRGFWPEEKVDGGAWPLRNPLYRRVYQHFKKLEVQFLARADHIISLTEEGKRELLKRPELSDRPERITVIPCCVDFDHFPLPSPEDRAAGRAILGIAPEARVLAYLGSIGSWYMLDEMLDFFRVYMERHPAALLLFITRDDPAAIRAAAAARSVPPGRVVVRPASREQVPRLTGAADLGLFFIRPVFSKKASSPTKMGEMLALGLPIVTNAGVGDVADIVDATQCGVAVEAFDDAAYGAAIERVEGMTIMPEIQRERALDWFNLEEGVRRYAAVYDQLRPSLRA